MQTVGVIATPDIFEDSSLGVENLHARIQRRSLNAVLTPNVGWQPHLCVFIVDCPRGTGELASPID
jgi:hypothetical protein